MNAETLYTIKGGRLVTLSPGSVTPRGLGAAIAYNLGSFVEEPGLAIGSWDQTVHGDRPAAMSFTSSGTIISVVVANMDGDTVPLAERIAAIHGWLEPMQLRDLSQLFKEPAAFYEGLWDMSPNATIALQDRRRYIVVTAEDDTAAHSKLADALGNADVDFVHLDVFTSDAGDDPIIRWSPDKGRPIVDPGTVTDGDIGANPVHTVDSDEPADPSVDAEPAPASRGERTVVAEEASIAAAGPEAADPDDQLADVEIDLRDGVADLPPPVVEVGEPLDATIPPPPAPAATFRSELVPGRTFEIGVLPMMFDPTDEFLESISDEMFAVPGHLVLVDKLPERRRQPSPFENPGRYRWDANVDQQTTLETHLGTGDAARLLHLFVESDRQPGLATYVGMLTTAAENKAGRYSTSMWFDVDPKVNAPLWQLFRKGRLPELDDASTAGISITPA